MKKSPKKCLFPADVLLESGTEDNCHQVKVSCHSTIPKSYPTSNSNMKKFCENLPDRNTSISTDVKSCQSVMKSSLSHHQSGNVVGIENVAQQSRVANENCMPSNKCSYKIFGVKKNLLLRSGVASFPTFSGLKIESSPKRIPLSPLKPGCHPQLLSQTPTNSSRQPDLPLFRLKLSDKENPESVMRTEKMSEHDGCSTTFSSLAPVKVKVTTECGKPSSPCPTTLRYSPISTASESSNLSDVTDSSTAPSSSVSDDVTHYSIRASGSDGPGTKLTLIRQSRPGTTTATSTAAFSNNNSSSTHQNHAPPNISGTQSTDCQHVPVDMSLKRRTDVDIDLYCRQTSHSVSSHQNPRYDTLRYKDSLSKQAFGSNNLNLKSQSLCSTSPSKHYGRGKENIPPHGAGVFPPISSHLRTFTPEPTVAQQLPQRRKHTSRSSIEHVQSRPSTAPPAMDSGHAEAALDLSHGSTDRRGRQEHLTKDRATTKHGHNQTCRDLPQMCTVSELNDKQTDRSDEIVIKENSPDEKKFTRPEQGPGPLWSTPTAPLGPLHSLPPPSSSNSLPSHYSLQPGTSSRLYDEYAYHGLYRPFYDNSRNMGRIGMAHPSSQVPVFPQTFAPRSVLYSDYASGFQPHSSLQGNHMTNLTAGALDIKEEIYSHERPASSSSDYSFRIPRVPLHGSSPIAAVKTEVDPLIDRREPELGSAQHMRPASVMVDVVGMDEDSEQNTSEPHELSNEEEQAKDENLEQEIDSGLATDLGCSTSNTNQGHLLRTEVITPPAGSEREDGKLQTPEGDAVDSGVFVTPNQHPQGKELFPDPVGASTPMEDDSLWRPWNKAVKNLKRFHNAEETSTSDLEASLPSNAKQQKCTGDFLQLSQPRIVDLSQETKQTRFISPVLPPRSEKHKTQNSPKRKNRKFSHSFSIAAMLSRDSSTTTRLPQSDQHSEETSKNSLVPYLPNQPLAIQPYSSLQLQPYIHPPASIAGTTNGPINLSSNPSLQMMAPSLRGSLPSAQQLYQHPPIMIHGPTHPQHQQAAAPFMAPHAILPFGTDAVPNTTQLHHLPGYPNSQPMYIGPITTSTSFAPIPSRPSTSENEVLDLSDTHRPAHHSHHHPTATASSSSSSPSDDYSAAHSSDAHTPQRSPSPALQLVNRPIVQPAKSQPIPGVMLSSPPRGARPASAFVHTKKLIPKRVLIEAKRKQAKADAGQAKKRDRPPQFGEDDINIFEVRFYESPERSIFCNDNHEFVVPKVPDSREKQDNLRDSLCRLFEKSNLPKVPSALRYNVHALAYYPFMQHLFHLYLVKDINIYDFKFGAYGQAFENPRLRDLGETEFNNRLDSMCYVGSDNLLHCLVMRHIDNGARCDHVASELGKMRRHAKNHYPEKKWVCCFCRAQMPDLTDMERHTSTHTSLKPFRCVDCNKFFSQKVTLANHMNQHHQKELEKMDPKKSFTCRQDGCLFQDHQREACIEHLENHHRDDEYLRRSRRGMWPFPPKSKSASRGPAKSSCTEFLPTAAVPGYGGSSSYVPPDICGDD